MSSRPPQSDPLDLLERILRGTNAVAFNLPTIVSLIGVIRGGREQGKTDDDIQAESMAIANRVIDKGNRQMSDES